MDADGRPPQKAIEPRIVAPLARVSLQPGVQPTRETFSNIMSPLKRSTAQSSLALPRAGPSFKPASTAPVDIDPQDERHAVLLAELGIKVRDFAYESKLPPVQPYRVRQIQPGPRPLKRVTRDGGADEEDIFQTSSKAEASSLKKPRLEREDTEPDMTQHQVNPARARGFVNINNYVPQTPSCSQSQPPWFSQPSSQPLESQESEPYVVTPIVTPNGSYQWPEVNTTSDVPASQLDTESQSNDPLLLTYSQFGMVEPESQPDIQVSEAEVMDTTGTGLVGKLTPMSSLSSIGSDAPASPLPLVPRTSNFAISGRDSPLTSFFTSSASHTRPTTPPAPASRYQLRRRPIPPSPQSPTKTGTRRKMYNAAHPLSHTTYPQQVPHSKGKASSLSRARVMRSHGGPSSHRDETMVVR
ncbi:hypothetical protein H0H87_001695 [Tephrocybe sp. NHM501043]|nr:hypothetical protein H0H87_001695 [Tephrocybe sp. NHM501043]